MKKAHAEFADEEDTVFRLLPIPKPSVLRMNYVLRSALHMASSKARTPSPTESAAVKSGATKSHNNKVSNESALHKLNSKRRLRSFNGLYGSKDWVRRLTQKRD